MYYLSLDTSGKTFYLSIADKLANDLRIRFQSEINARNDSGDIFPEFLTDSLISAGLDLSQIDRFYIGLGPGSFTGLRIGNSYLKGIAFACGKPLIGIPSFTGMAFEAKRLQSENSAMQCRVFNIIRPAGREEFFYLCVNLNGDVFSDLPSIVSKEQLIDICCAAENSATTVFRVDEKAELTDFLNHGQALQVENFSASFFEADSCCSGKNPEKVLNNTSIIYTRAVSAKTIEERKNGNTV